MTVVVTMYRYGWIAWVWRIAAVVGVTAATLLLYFAIRFGTWTFAVMALPLGVPSVVLPMVLAVRIDRVTKEEVVVTNLFFVRRHIRRESLGQPRVRLTAQGTFTHIAATRAWIPVRGGWPIYVDLFADIPDPGAFRSFIRLRLPQS